MEEFKKYLLSNRVVKNKSLVYYLSWVNQFFNFHNKTHLDEASQVEIDSYLKHLTKTREAWQVQQAEDAINLYLFYRNLRLRKEQRTQSDAKSKWITVSRDMVRIIRLKHLSINTEKTYIGWIKSFYRFLNGCSPYELTSTDVKNFLTYLAVERNVAAATQNQAFNALLFMFRFVINKDLEDIRGVIRSSRKKRLPVVLTRQEVAALFKQMDGIGLLMAKIAYGCGLRRREIVKLRVQDIDFSRNILIVKSGKGDKDRQTVLPESINDELKAHLDQNKQLFDLDRKNNVPGVELPYALERKYPNAGKELGWFWVFPAQNLSMDPRSKIVRRHHIHPTFIQKKIKNATKMAGIVKKISIHTLRHSFATDLLQGGVDIRSIQDILGHESIETTMIYTHIVKQNQLGIKSPLDKM